MVVSKVLDTALDRTLIGYGNVGYLVRRARWPGDEPAPGSLEGRTALVTGAKSGIGKAIATGLARLGATVHMAVRDTEQGEAARADVLREVPGAEVAVDECDVSSLAGVRAFAEALQARTGALDVLVHNAGVMPPRREVTAEGNEIALATHVLGPHLLTALLLPALRRAPGARVIWVSSGGMYAQPLRIDDLQYEQGDYNGTAAYARTKRMQVVLSREWAERAYADSVISHAGHPGWADTPGVSSSLPLFRTLTRPLLRTPEQGADTFVWLAAAERPGLVTGRFWHDREIRPEHYLARTRETGPDRTALWEACQRLTGLESQGAAPGTPAGSDPRAA